MSFVRSTLFILTVSLCAWGDGSKLKERAQLLEQFNKTFGAPLETVFKDHATNPALEACRTKLKDVRKLYADARKAKNYSRMEAILIGRTPLPGAEPSSLIKLMNKCGPCVSKVSHEDGTSVYYSEGWCKSASTDKAKLNASVDRGIKFLRNLNAMQKKNNGFNYIMEFLGIDSKTGAHLKSNSVTEMQSPFLAYIAVKGFSLAAFSYLGEVNFLDRDKDPVRNFIMGFKATDKPEIEEPEVYDHPKGALSFPLFEQRLGTVDGNWFLDAEGYRNYTTSADFEEFGVDGLESLAEQIMMDTVHNLNDMLEAE